MNWIWVIAVVVAVLVTAGIMAVAVVACMAERPESESDRSIAARGIEDESKGGKE